MVETSLTVALLEPEPATEPEVRLTGVHFAEGDLKRPDLTLPRYPTLYDEKRISQLPRALHFEPSFQVQPGTGVVALRFELDPGSPELEPDGRGGVRIRTLAAPGEEAIPGLVGNELLDARSCRLRWDQTLAATNLTAMRIYCRLPDDATIEEQVEGGLYLAVSGPPSQEGTDTTTPVPYRALPEATVTLQGFTDDGRLVYDLLSPEVYAPVDPTVPPGVAAELGVRVSEARAFGLHLVLAPEALVFSSLPDGRVEALPGQPDELPTQILKAQLAETGTGFDPKRCDLHWLQLTGRQLCRTPPTESLCTSGGQSSFFLQAREVRPDLLARQDLEALATGVLGADWSNRPSAELIHALRTRLRELHAAAAAAPALWSLYRKCLVDRGTVDPTVIQPPPCDPNGICISMAV